MRKSQVNARFEFDEDIWVVSVLNTGAATGGHAILVVEGMQAAQLFVGQYDIRAQGSPAPGSSVNIIGQINNVFIRESNNYSYPGGYQKLSSQSFTMDARCFPDLKASILADKDITDKANTSGSGHIKYELVGSKGVLHALFGSDYGGINCAEWCQRKLKVIGLDAGKLAEKVPMPQKSTTSLSNIVGYTAVAAVALFAVYKGRDYIADGVQTLIASVRK